MRQRGMRAAIGAVHPQRDQQESQHRLDRRRRLFLARLDDDHLDPRIARARQRHFAVAQGHVRDDA